MVEIKKTGEFEAWMLGLKDGVGRARIAGRIDRLAMGNPGDSKLLTGTGGVFEMRLDFGPGYRVYYVRRGDVVIVLLCGGDKRSQKSDITTAKRLAKEV